MNEKELKETKLTDQEMEQVQGGYEWCKLVDPVTLNSHFYEFIGDNQKDRDRKYVCPICGHRVHYGKAWRFYCDDCNKSWFLERNLMPNLHSGVWQEFDWPDYCDSLMGV